MLRRWRHCLWFKLKCNEINANDMNERVNFSKNSLKPWKTSSQPIFYTKTDKKTVLNRTHKFHRYRWHYFLQKMQQTTLVSLNKYKIVTKIQFNFTWNSEWNTNQIKCPCFAETTSNIVQHFSTKPFLFNCRKTKHSEVRNCTSTVGKI